MPSVDIRSVVDYSNETQELTIESLMKKGFSAYEASAYLSKLNIQKLFENDNDCKNIEFSPELHMPPDRMANFKQKKKRKVNNVFKKNI